MDTAFRNLSRMITVRDLAEPFREQIGAETPTALASQAWIERCDDLGIDPMEQICLVERHGHIVGWIGFDMLDAGRAVGDCAEAISTDAIVTSNTPIIEALPALTESRYPFLFTLEKKSLVGWISFGHLCKLQFRLCLFSLLLGVEQLCSELLKTTPSPALAVLRPKRMDYAREVYARRGSRLDDAGKEFEVTLLDCTTFIDKIEMVRRVFGNVVPASKSSYFTMAERIRNELAHTRVESDLAEHLKRDTLLPLIEWAETIQAEITKVVGRR